MTCEHCEHKQQEIDAAIAKAVDYIQNEIYPVHWVAKVAGPNVPGSEAHTVPHVGWSTPFERRAAKKKDKS